MRNKILYAGGFIVLGTLIVLGIRFVTFKHDDVHYHANFALYINGKREEFKGAQYYTETEVCAAEKTMTPAERAHMHDNINNVVHVEDDATTWGQFFTNLGWTLGPDFIQSPDGTIYQSNGANKLHIVINGKDYTGLGAQANTVINDADRVLFAYGNEDSAALQKEYKAIPATAHKYDVTPDPESCSGHEGASYKERLRHLF